MDLGFFAELGTLKKFLSSFFREKMIHKLAWMDAIFSKILGQFLIVHLLHNVPLNDNQEK